MTFGVVVAVNIKIIVCGGVAA